MKKVQNGKVPPNVEILGLTFAFFAVGIGSFLVAMIGGVWVFPSLIREETFRSTAGWTFTHLFVLGWVTMIAMGASYQLTQVILRTSLFSRKLGYLHFVFYVLGILILVFGFSLDLSEGISLGGMFIVFSVMIYVFNLTMTCVKKREWNPYIFGASFSLFHLLLTVGLGGFMALTFSHGWGTLDYELLFLTHIWLGMVGWLSGFIVVYSFKLLPMFLVSPKRVLKEAYIILSLFHAGVLLRVIALWLDLQTLEIFAFLLLFISLSIFVLVVRKIRVHSRGKQTGAVIIAYQLIPFIFGLFLFWVTTNTFFPHFLSPQSLNAIIIVFLILGWFSATILSYLSKIIPFLWWAYLFQTKWKKKRNVLLSEMISEKRITTILYGYLLGVVLVGVAFLFSVPMLAAIGQIASTLLLFAYIAELTRTFQC